MIRDEPHLTMCGTPNYISPEVATRSSHGLQTDVWGLGCMLYTMLVGTPPFDTKHVKSTLTRVVMDTYKVPPQIFITSCTLKIFKIGYLCYIGLVQISIKSILILFQLWSQISICLPESVSLAGHP